MKTLTYFLITDCFPWRPVGFDTLLRSPKAINDCCSLELSFGISECPVIWQRNPSFMASLSMLYNLQEKQRESSQSDSLYRENTRTAVLHLLGSVWLHSQQACFIRS